MFSNIGSGGGRLGNEIIRNFTVYLLSEKYKSESKYKDCESIGLVLKTDNINYKKEKKINDTDVINFLEKNSNIERDTNYVLDSCYCQSPTIINHMIKYFDNIENIQCKNIIINNKFKHRYNNNNDLFIHIRAGDIFTDGNRTILPSINYYRNILKNDIKYDNIYLSTDNFDHVLCRSLLSEYKIKPYNNNLIDTILFGSTCKNIIISSGSFSFLIGLLGFYSETIYINKRDANRGGPGDYIENNKIKDWHPDYYPEFNKVNNKKFIFISS